MIEGWQEARKLQGATGPEDRGQREQLRAVETRLLDDPGGCHAEARRLPWLEAGTKEVEQIAGDRLEAVAHRKQGIEPHGRRGRSGACQLDERLPEPGRRVLRGWRGAKDGDGVARDGGSGSPSDATRGDTHASGSCSTRESAIARSAITRAAIAPSRAVRAIRACTAAVRPNCASFS